MCEQCNQSDSRLTRLECKYEDLSRTVFTTEATLKSFVKAMEELNISIRVFMDKQEKVTTKQDEKIEKLQSEPANRWNASVTVIITLVISTIIGFLFSNFLPK